MAGLGAISNKRSGQTNAGFTQNQNASSNQTYQVSNNQQNQTNIPSLRETYAKLLGKMQSDPANASQYSAYLGTLTTDPNSPWYNPYSQANSTKWTESNEKRTNNALAELNDIQNRINYWVSRTDRNYSDDEIFSMINIDDYSTLSSLEKNRQQGFPLEVLAPVDYSDDAIYGMIWSARNGGQTSGSYAVDAAMGLMGRGNQSPANSRAEMLDATSERFAPYKAGKSVSTDKYAYQFGLTGDFDQNWLNQNTWMLNNPDLQPTYTKIFKAEQNTLELEAIVDEWNDYVEKQIDAGVDPEMIFGDSVFESHKEFAPIKKLIDSYASGDLVETTRAINFDYNDQRRRAQAEYERTLGDEATEEYEENVASALKAEEPVKKPDGFFKNAYKKTHDFVVGLFDNDRSEEETVALKTDDGSFPDVKNSVITSVETSQATTDDMHDVVVSEADSYAYKNLLPANRRIKELENAKAAFAAVEAFETKWNAEIESGNIHIYENPEYQADLRDVEAAYALYDEFGGNLAAVEEELAEQMEIRGEVMRQYGLAESYSDYDSSDESALQVLGFIEQYADYTDDMLHVPSYDWQDALTSGEKTWEETSAELTSRYASYGGLIENINTAIEVASANGLDASYLEGLRATKRAVLKEREAIRTAQLRDNPDFEEKVRAFDAGYKPYKAPFINIKGVTDPSREEAITSIIHDPSAALTELGGYVPDINVGQMTEDERNIYKYIYMTEGVESAIQYAETLKDALGWRLRDSMMEEAEVTSVGDAVGKNLASIMLNTASFVGVFENMLSSVKGEEIDVNSPLNILSSYSGGIRQSTQEKIAGNKWLQEHGLLQDIALLGYDAVMTTADSTAASLTGSKFLSLGLMGASSAQSTLVDAKMRGASDTQAFLLAGVTGMTEVGTEFIPLDHLFETFENAGTLGVKEMVGRVLKGTIEDAPGEMISEFIGGISDDLIMQEMSASEMRVTQLMEENGMRRYEAEKQAQKEAVSDILYAGLLSMFTTGGKEMLAYGSGKLLNRGDYARDVVDLEEVATKTDEGASAKTKTSEPDSAPKTPVATTARTAATPAEKAAIVKRDNKLLSGQYTLDKNGQAVPKQPKRGLSESEKISIALKEALRTKHSITADAATFSAALQLFGKIDSVTADAVSKAFVSKFEERALSEFAHFLGYERNMFSPSEIVAFMVDAVNNGKGEAAIFASRADRSSGDDYGLREAVQSAVNNVTAEEIQAFVKKNAVAGATVDILRQVDTSKLDAIVAEERTAREKLKKAEGEYRKVGQQFTEHSTKALKAANELKHAPENERFKKELLESRKKMDELRPKLAELEAEYKALSNQVSERSADWRSEKARLVYEARTEATKLVDGYFAERIKAEEAAAAQAEADAIAQQEADNLSEMEFQNYVEETAPDATPEQVEELRQEFAEQRQTEEQIVAEEVAKEEANGNIQTPEQKAKSEAESKALRNAEALGKRFKTNVKTMDLPSNINGWYDGDKNELVINSNLSQEQMIEETVIHEFSHKAERGGKAYASYSQALLDLAYNGDRKKIKAEIDKVKRKRNSQLAQMSQVGGQETYGKDLRFIDDDGARKELVAQATKELLKGDPELIERFANTDIDSAYSFFDRLKYVLKRMVGIKGTYAEQLKHTAHLFQKALAKAAENGAKTTKQRIDESQHPASVQFSIDQWAKATGFGFERSADNKGGYIIVDKDGNKVDKVTKEMMVDTPAGKLVSTAVAKGTMSNEEADSANQFLADVMNMVVEFEDQETVWEMVGSALFSSVKNNSDKQYGRTVDYGTICSKTRDIVNVMSETMLEKGRGLTREEVIMAYNKTFGEGMSVPCPPCYVFSRWMGVPSLLETIRKGQERFANATDADVNSYVNSVKERYASELAKPKKNGEEKTLAGIMGTRKTNILNKLEDIRKQVASEKFNESSLAEVREQQQALEAELEDIELYNWVTQVLCETDSKGKPIEKNGQLVIDKKYKAVPNEVLLDMRETGKFASDYAKAWRFRTTRGAGMGKAQLPYAGAEVGDVLTGAKRWKANENPLYTGDDAKAKRALANAAKRTLAQNLIGGNRFQSTSDFRPEWGLDYLMTFFEMQAIGAKGQLYTKVIEAADLFASAGIEVNLSVMAKGDGWHLDENGNPVITLEDFSSVAGIDAGQAMQKSQEYDNVQLILVGMNDTHIELALADDRISFVIPWHSSGNSKEVLGQMMEAVGERRGKAQDYSDVQTDKIGEQTPEQKAAWDMRKKILTGGFYVKGKNVQPTDAEMATIAGNPYLLDLYNKMYIDSTSDAYHVKLSAAQASQIFPHEYWDTNSTYDTADVNGQRFVEYCESMGIQPRFAQFADKKGYWKLLIDRRMYGRDGNYRAAGYINASNVKVNALPQAVSQAKPGTNEQIQNAKQKLIDEIDARTADLHKFDMEAEHAAPEPAIPANVQFSLADDSDVIPWDDTLTVKANIENLPSTKVLDEKIQSYRERYNEINKELNKRFGSDFKAKFEFTRSNDPLARELYNVDIELSRAVEERRTLERKMFSSEASIAHDRYLELKREYDEKKAAHNRYRSAEPFYNYQPKLVDDYEAAKKEYEAKFVPELEKRRAAELKHREWLAKREAEKKAAEEKARAEEEAKKAAEMAVAEPEVTEKVAPAEEKPVAVGEATVAEDVAPNGSAEGTTKKVEEPAPTQENVAEEPATPEPTGIYEDVTEGSDDDYGGEEAQPEPTNEFTYGTLDPAFSIPTPPSDKRVHETSKKFVADETLPDAIRTEHAKPEEAFYDPDSNEAQNARAAQKIRSRGIDAEYGRLMNSTDASADNIAGLQILREIYNREGTRDMAKLMDVTRKEIQLRSKAGTALQASKSEIAKMMPSEIIARFVGEGEDSLEKHIKEYPKAAEKLKQKAAEKTEVVKSVVGDADLDEVSEDNKWLEPLNKAQLEAIKMYGLEKVERAGIFYNRATVEQRMLEAIIQTKDPFADTGMGMNLFERLEYIRSGAQCLTIADLNYIQRNLGEFTHFGGMTGGRTADIAINRAIEAYGNTNVASGFEKFRSFRYVNMLTSLASAIKNLGSNAVQILGAVNVSHELEAGLDALIGNFTGKRTKATLNVQERIDGWNAFKNESVNTFRDYFVYKVDTNPKNDPFNTHRKGRVYQGKVFEGARNLQSFLMSFGDRNFWKRAYINSLAEQQKMLDAGKLFNEDGSVPTEEQIIERAKYEADYATLSEDNFVSKMFKLLAYQHPVAADVISFYMPFTGIPTNVIKRGVEYSPINAVVTVFRALIDKKKGRKFDQRRFVEGVCRPLTAAGVYMLGSMLYNAGKIKMGTGDDEDEGTKYYDARTALGDQYSAYFVGNETNSSLSSLGPYGTMLLYGAAVSSELEKQGEDGKRWLVAMYNAMNHNIDSIIDASYLSGITDFFNPNLDESIGETALRLFIENASGQMIPAPIAQLAEYLDPYVRETKDKNKIIEVCKNVANKIPYLRQTLPKKVYVTGTAAKTREPAVTKFFDPFTRSHQYEEPELEAAMSLYEEAKKREDDNAAKLLPEDVLRGKKTSFKYEGGEYELTDEQKEAFKIHFGEIWKPRVAEQINSPGWDALTWKQKTDRIKTIMTQSKNENMEWAIEKWFE